MEYDDRSNRLIIEYELTSLSIDYVVRSIGLKMSRSMEDRLIVAKIVKDEFIKEDCYAVASNGNAKVLSDFGGRTNLPKDSNFEIEFKK